MVFHISKKVVSQPHLLLNIKRTVNIISAKENIIYDVLKKSEKFKQ
jgi:hypothetical protein